MNRATIVSHLELTGAKDPHAFAMNIISNDPRIKGRLPIIFAPAAVNNVAKPIQRAERPMTQVFTVSALVEYCSEIKVMAVVSIAAMLMST
jgi:hypothetical protein